MEQLPAGTVTLLFTDVEGSTTHLKELGPERYSDLLGRHHELIHRALGAHGGIEVENRGDGLFAVFGSAKEAVAAAVEPQRSFGAEHWPTRRPLAVRMGLHTGEALVRSTGYVGYAVHHAARIADMGHGGQVLLSGATAGAVRRALPAGARLRSLGELAIADADRPQPLYRRDLDGLRNHFPPLRVRQRRMLAQTPDRLLERAGELALLGDLVEAPSTGAGRFGVVVGDAGIGKTTLVRQVRSAAELRGMEILQARGGELEHEFSYGIVRQLFESRLAGSPAEERQRILSGPAALAESLFDERALATAAVGPADTSFAFLHGLYWLTANLAAQRPLLLLVDDLHLADEPSLRWLGYLVRRLDGIPVLVVAALRPPDQGFQTALLAELVNDPAAEVVAPSALSGEAVDELVRSTLSADADAAFSAACHDATGGNPLLLRALLDALASERVPPRADYSGAVMEIGPRAVSRAIELRLARLPEEATAVARAAAVLGEDADLTVLAELAELDRDLAAHVAAELDGRQLELRRLLEGGLLSVTSIFPPLYPIALQQIDRIADLELGDDLGSRTIEAILSYDDARRLAPCELAVERAERALAAGPLHSEDNAAYVFAAYGLALADRFAQAEAVWDRAWADAQVRGSISGYAIASTFRTFGMLHTGRLDEALTDARNGLEACRAYGLVAALPYAAAHIADAALELGDVGAARAAIDALDAAGDGSHLTWAFLDSRGRTRIAGGDLRGGLEDVLLAARQYEAMRGRNPSLLAWRSTAALAYLELGDRDEAARLAHEEVALAREWGQPRGLGQALRAAGVVERDVELLHEAVAVLEASPARLARAKALVALGAALRAAGDTADAQDVLLDALELARAMRAAPLVQRSEAELSALGIDVPEPPRTGFDALSASERRMAAFAAEGLAVDEIAQTLFVTPATVDEYLARARRTLGVQSNEELVRAVSSSPSEAAPRVVAARRR